MKNLEKLQTLLPLGYLYLVVLGILKETAFLYQLDINILKYSSIMDVLMSPIATMMSHPVIFGVIFVVFFMGYHLPSFIYKNAHKKWVQQIFELHKVNKDLSDAETKNHYLFFSLRFTAFFLLSIYLGFGFAEGRMNANKMKQGKLKYNYELTYTDGQSKTVSLIETNSVYYFYVTKGEKSVTIAPIGGIKDIRQISKAR